MLVIEVTYKKPLTEVDKYLSEHVAWLQSHYDDGSFIASGRKQPREGGIILSYLDKAQAQLAVEQDPFYQYEIADYHIVQFEVSKCSTAFQQVLDNE